MILKASERGNGNNLAAHLMNARDNEHVELHELRGFIADDLHGAFKEADAISRGTRCQNYLFSLSLSPPEHEDVPPEVFEAAIENIERRLKLEDQPRAIVFHEKEGRRHAHAVWSRINVETMTAVNLPHFKRKLNDISRNLYIEHGWEMPDGFKKGRNRDPLTFTMAEWQQAQRTGHNPRHLKATMQDAWKSSDSKASFQTALRENGLFLARGDRRGFVALDHKGEVYSLTRYSDLKAKELQARIGDPKDLPSVDDAKHWIAQRMEPQVKAYVAELEEKYRKKGMALSFERKEMVDRHRHARKALQTRHDQRWETEQRKRAERLPRGMKGLWSWVTGKTKKIKLQNELEALRAQERDRAERQAIITKQLSERRKLQTKIVEKRKTQQRECAELSRDVAHYIMMGGKDAAEVTRDFEHKARTHDDRLQKRTRNERAQSVDRSNGPDFDLS